jgi:hypothetical protein
MQHAALVRRKQAAHHRPPDRQRVLGGRAVPSDALGKGHALDEWPDHVQVVAVAPGLERRTKERVIDAPQQVDFVFEAQLNAARDVSGRSGLDHHGDPGLRVRAQEGGHAAVALDHPEGHVTTAEVRRRYARRAHRWQSGAAGLNGRPERFIGSWAGRLSRARTAE